LKPRLVRGFFLGASGMGARIWSPQQISRRLLIDFPHDMHMRISHEAIYQALYVQGRGALRRELSACLRTGRALRAPRARTRQRGNIVNLLSTKSWELQTATRPCSPFPNARPRSGYFVPDFIRNCPTSAWPCHITLAKSDSLSIVRRDAVTARDGSRFVAKACLHLEQRQNREAVRWGLRRSRRSREGE
jgi:hypothetical protein